MKKNSLRLARWLMALALGSALVVGLAACSSGSAASADGATLLNARCNSCHTLTLVTSLKQSRAEWDLTVSKMIKRGVSLTTSEKTVLVDYLAQTYGP